MGSTYKEYLAGPNNLIMSWDLNIKKKLNAKAKASGWLWFQIKNLISFLAITPEYLVKI